MVELTKKECYTLELVEGLLENRAYLSHIIGSELGADIIPILDFELAIKRTNFSEAEERVLNARYGKDNFCDLTTVEVAKALGLSDRYVRRTSRIIVRKVLTQMNRGLSHV